MKPLRKFVVLMDNVNLRDSEARIRGSINFIKANYILQNQSVREWCDDWTKRLKLSSCGGI